MGIYAKLEEKAIKRFKEAEDDYRDYIHKPIYTGNGILDLIKPAEPITLKVEDLYAFMGPMYWDILDELLEDRVDLHDRIERYKKNPGSQALRIFLYSYFVTTNILFENGEKFFIFFCCASVER